MNNQTHLGLMLDCSRNGVMKPKAIRKMIDILEKLEYNTLMLYTEDTYEVDNQPYFGYLRGKYSKEELKDIDDYAFSKGIELIPCIQTLAHLNCLVRWVPYYDICDCNDILLVGSEKTYKLIDDMFSTLAQCFRSKTVNIGMDEADMLGFGQYMQKNGLGNRVEIFCKHLQMVADIAKKYGFTCCMWSDMFYNLAFGSYQDKNETVQRELPFPIPDNVQLIYWNYHGLKKEVFDHYIINHKKLSDNFWFAGGTLCANGFAPHIKRALKSLKPALDSCKDNNVNNVLLTCWGDDGNECSRFSNLPLIVYFSCYYRGITDEDIIKKIFFEIVGISFDDFSILSLPYTPNEYETIITADKYLTYNDFFLGISDCTVADSVPAGYKKCSKLLTEHCGNEEWGVLFRTLKSLCELLELKSTIGLRTREAYINKNITELKSIITDYDKIILRLEDFYNAIDEQWNWENKPHGFDVMDIRLGGIIRRANHCKKRLQEFVNGKVDSIPELDEKILDYFGRGENIVKEPIHFGIWKKICTPNTIA